jgi:hypothetical protein
MSPAPSSATLPAAAQAGVSHDAALEATALRKITWRIMPFLFLVYVLSYLDRSTMRAMSFTFALPPARIPYS